MVDFSLLGQGPQFKDVLSAFQSGQMARKETDTKNALALYATDPEGGISALNKVDPILGFKLRDDYTERKAAADRKAVFSETDPTKRTQAAQATGDPDTIKAVMTLDATQRAQKKEATDAVGGFVFGLLKNVPYEQRKAAIQQNMQGLQEAGFTPEQLQSYDPTDANLQATLAQVQTLDQALSMVDKEADNERAAAQLEEAKRHNRAMEGTGAINAESRRISATKPRASSGGRNASSLPPPPSGWKPVGG